MSRAKHTIISEIIIVVKLILLAPTTNAEGERIFSGLRRVKTYLQSTMGDIRLNDLMALYIHKNSTDELDQIDVANKFVGDVDSRKRPFGTFVKEDLLSRDLSTTSYFQHV